MKQSFLLMALLFFGLISMNAQDGGDFEVGVGGGFGVSYANNPEGMSTDLLMAFNANISAEVYLSDYLGVKTKIIYDNKGYANGFIIDNNNGNMITDVDFKLSYITVPIMANFHFGKKKFRKWYVNVGPYIGFLVNAEETALGIDISEAFNTIDIGGTLGIGT